MGMGRPFTFLTLISTTAKVQSFASGIHRGNSAPGLVAASVAPSSWKPRAQPRFDEFASRTVGPWIATSSRSPTGGAPPAREVEEVMRSCGGAVQGIRELPLSAMLPAEGAAEERTYHNRADGGFVYADDGSYSAGPAQWDLDAFGGGEAPSNPSNAKPFMASLAFSGFRRMWIVEKPSEAAEAVAKSRAEGSNVMHQMNPKFLDLSRPISNLENADYDRIAMELVSSHLPNVRWNAIQRARMPNPNQTWSLARAKWERQGTESQEQNGELDAAEATSGNIGPLMGWVFVEIVSEGEENAPLGDVLDSGAINLHMLAACPVSGTARSVVRCYDANGLLKSVAFLHGLVSNTDEQM